ncbi:hypothetical protein G4B88_001857 [Cannabis sativa]|uniref:non-specific serine/threonine protein kinase n=1 Tax=Cannabis sativa TaxID=3483 RepID=A0A7J6I2B3_CANSA|nr:hypothetical protein G4B88_001857 [Cannabis sativa]
MTDQSSLHINCGGPQVTVKNVNGSLTYEGDEFDGYNSAVSKSITKTWGFSSIGDAMDDNDKINNHVVHDDNNLFKDSGDLYITARKSPLSLTYFGCLQNGMYTVKLHFAELEFDNVVGRRIFDIYIQGKKMLVDFNIHEEATRSGSKVVVQEYFNVNVTDNIMEIRFYWAGKGTTCVPKRGYYGILVSAISVCPKPNSPNRIPLVVGISISVFCLILLIIDTKTTNMQRKHQAFALQRKEDLLVLIDPNLESNFNKEEAERVLKLALLCTNASPTLRPTMSEVVGMLEEQTAITNVVSDPDIFRVDLENDLRFKSLKNYYQQVQRKNSSEIQGSSSFNKRFSEPSTSSSAHDLYQVNLESLSLHDLYEINPDSMNNSDISSLVSGHSSSAWH